MTARSRTEGEALPRDSAAWRPAGLPGPKEIERLLDPMLRVSYAPPHVFPVSVPRFALSPATERHRPAFDHLRLYVHVPFCRYRCSFCFYAVKVGLSVDSMERYVAALERELEWVEPGTALSQLFVGGGTPTALPPTLLDRLLSAVFGRMRDLGAEVHTVEASPETVSVEHLGVLREQGIGRVSMGIQTLDDQVLSGVHRRHSAADALAACRRLGESGLIANVDLIYGLPGQTEESFRRDLEAVVEQGVHSVTLYNLRVNERTPVTRALGEGEALDLERLIRWRAYVRDLTDELGFEQVRWHCFRLRGSLAERHRRAPCFTAPGVGYQLGIGLSARSSLGHTIYRNHTGFLPYLQRVEAGESPVEEIFILEEVDRRTRFVARTIGDGKAIEREVYEEAFGRSFDEDYGEPLGRMVAAGLVRDDGRRLELTEAGKLVYDLVTLAFYPSDALDWLRARQAAVA